MPKRKSFIDKKHSVAFRLLHRSQKDPLIALDDGQMVLAPVEGVEKLRITEQRQKPVLNKEERKVEQVKCGVYFEDDYDYLQHLKDANEVYSLEPVQQRFRIFTDGQSVDAGRDIPETSSRLTLPSDLFESQGFELKIGLLNQAAPRPGPHPELDPDIVAALDDDNFDFMDPDGQLEDDFIVKANASAGLSADINDNGADSDAGSGGSSESGDSESESECGEDNRFEEEETKSRFTNYSLTSSVMRRSQGLQQVDAMFEKLYEQYDDEEVGDLDTVEEEITGFLDPDGQRMQHLIDEYEEDMKMKKKVSEIILNEKPDDLKRKIVASDDDDEEELEKVYIDERPKEKWDCESVLSTYSTLYNHPTVISEPKNGKRKIKLDPRTGLPRGVLKSASLAPILKELEGRKEIQDDDVEDMDCCESNASTIRSKFETPEQRRLRKQAVKSERKERRIEKKSNKLAFKSEAKRRHCVQLNLQNNLAGVKLL